MNYVNQNCNILPRGQKANRAEAIVRLITKRAVRRSMRPRHRSKSKLCKPTLSIVSSRIKIIYVLISPIEIRTTAGSTLVYLLKDSKVQKTPEC